MKPTDNASIEALNSKFRSECLDAHWFMSLDDASSKMEEWRIYFMRKDSTARLA